ncbi:hypothetical protein E3N88_45245 [Mikania micrantha]|uniref:Cupin type-1 domain-containing protein n=1 Tax=Mikania micrantha TaxID=192012 RepID=A0A5N6L9Q4_9ASTR|nr:hypothetical protein E3N88_45245 [Mikania micrantha]
MNSPVFSVSPESKFRERSSSRLFFSDVGLCCYHSRSSNAYQLLLRLTSITDVQPPTCTSFAFASDPSPLQDFCVADPESPVLVNGVVCKDPKVVQADDFLFRGLHLMGNTSNNVGSNVTLVNVEKLRGLNTFGISMARIDFAPMGINPPHTHPRATEILTVIEGTILVGFVTSNTENRLITKVLEKGDVFVFPEGLIHFQKNLGNGYALALAALSSQNPGVITIANAVFGSNPNIAADILAKAFQTDISVVSQIQSKFKTLICCRSFSLPIAFDFLGPSFLRIRCMNSPVFSVSPESKFRERSSSRLFFSDVGLCCYHSRSSNAYQLLLRLTSITDVQPPTCTSFAFASDPSPLQDFCVADPESPVLVNGVVCKDPKVVQADDFLFRGLHLMGNTSNNVGSNVTLVNVEKLRGLNTFGISMARIDFAPMGINPPHTHPRATEILTVIEGTILVGFVTSNTENRLITKVLEKGDVFVFPEGLIHFQKNLGNGYALALAALSSQNPGVITIANAVFGSNPNIAADILAKAFQTDISVVSQIQSKFKTLICCRSFSLPIAFDFLGPSFLRIRCMNSPVFSVSPESKFRERSSSRLFFSDVGLCCYHSRSSNAYQLLLRLTSITDVQPPTCTSFAFASDPSPLQDFCVADPESPVLVNGVVCKDPKVVQADDFLFRGLHLMGNTSNNVGSNVTLVNVEKLRGLNTFGISMARIDFAPMGINPPHTHPRATEILTVIEGTILVGFVTSNTENRLITKVLEKGDVFVFPEGLIHFQKNLGNGYALALAALSSQNPGVITIANAVFGSNPNIAADILAKAFQTDISVVSQIQSKFKTLICCRSFSLPIAIDFLGPSFLRIRCMNSPVFSVSPESKFRARSSSRLFFSDVGLCCYHSRSSNAYHLLLRLTSITDVQPPTCTSFAFASDPSPLQDFCVADPESPVLVNGVVCKDPKVVQADDFLFRGLHLMGNTSNNVGSNVTLVNVEKLRGLNTFGISMARIDFAPMGINPPHTHPRATEILTVIEGTILVGFVTSNTENRLITKVLEKGDVFVFPEGLIHFQKNLGNGYALALAALSSQNPGVITIANAVFGSNPNIAADILAKAFQTDISVVSQIQSKFKTLM